MNAAQRVSKEIAQLRAIFEQSETRSKERVWLRNQPSGDLDDARLVRLSPVRVRNAGTACAPAFHGASTRQVDGAVGERLVYKRRGEEELSMAAGARPTRVKFVVDVSGSMYRFNGQDVRWPLVALALTATHDASVAGSLESCLGVHHNGDGGTAWFPAQV